MEVVRGERREPYTTLHGSGRGRLRLEDEEAEVHTGDAVVIPPGTRHKLLCTGSEPLVVLCSPPSPYSDDDTLLCE